MIPSFLLPADQIRIVSPSGSIDPTYIDGAKKTLTAWGLHVTEGKFARQEYGRFAGTESQRISDLQDALDDTDVKAVLCSRGGYGISQIIDKIDFTKFAQNPKWLIGFSDVTILHNAITNIGIASIHGIMAKQLTELSANSEPVEGLKSILQGTFPRLLASANALNRTGKTEGKLIGGNLSVLMGLRGSEFDLPYRNNILFIEDIAEKPYHIDRMMQNLRIGGVLKQISGLIVGQFSDCDEDPLMKKTIYEIIQAAVGEYRYPVCFNFQAGHVDNNLALILGSEVEFEVMESGVSLNYKAFQ